MKKKNLGSGTTTLITSNKEIEDIIRIFKSLEESGLLMKDVSETIKNKAKELKRGSLGTGASLLENLSARKVVIRAGEGEIKAVQEF